MALERDRPVKIAVIGDVHDLWAAEDALALQALAVDLALFVGDFGNEAVEVVRAIAALDLPIAVAFGNHDAWYTATPWGVKQCPYDRTQEDRVQQQLDLVGEAHVGYRWRDFTQFGFSVVGGRPFSWGGPDWKNGKFYQERFGITNFAASAERMIAATQSAQFNTVLFLGHNGPTGLGDQAEDPCGKDWYPLGGDHGDPDLDRAIAAAKAAGKQVPLVTFGHMHHSLRHTKERLRTAMVQDHDGTIYLNAASVPRVIQTPEGWRRNFSLVTLEQGVVTDVSLVWVDQTYQVVAAEILYCEQPVVIPSA